jgi:signal transduction histidine kinase
MKHAQASNITVCLKRSNGAIVLTVNDDGQRKRRARRGLGTLMMEYRANAIGGTLKMAPREGPGTSVTCRVPRKR